LYGSLGLASTLKLDLETQDIDMLVEDKIFQTQLIAIHAILFSCRFKLIDERENTFQRGTLEVGIASDGDMLDFSGVDPSSLTVILGEARYRILSAEQYLAADTFTQVATPLPTSELPSDPSSGIHPGYEKGLSPPERISALLKSKTGKLTPLHFLYRSAIAFACC
jgi:hypothetical protein